MQIVYYSWEKYLPGGPTRTLVATIWTGMERRTFKAWFSSGVGMKSAVISGLRDKGAMVLDENICFHCHAIQQAAV